MISRKSKTSYKLWSLKNALTRKFETASDYWYIILCKNNKIRVRVLGENVQFIAHCFICTSMKQEIFVIIFYEPNVVIKNILVSRFPYNENCLYIKMLINMSDHK